MTVSGRSTGHRAAVRIEGACLAAVAAATALLTASVDASSIALRVGGERVAERPSWLVGFAIALFTATLGLWVFEDGIRLHRSAVALCVGLAIANVVIAGVQLALTQAAWVLPATHLVAAGLLAAIATSHDRGRTGDASPDGAGSVADPV